MELEDIKKVLIIGAGTMGQQIGFQCAIHGFEIALYDVAQDVLDRALTRLEELAGGFVAAGKLSQADAKRALDRIEISTDAARAAGDADLVSESVPEDPDLKSRVFAQFNALCPERTVFTTNTSSLLPSMLAEATGRPDRFAAFHFHDIRFTRIVDIMPHPGTAPKTVTLIKAFADKIGQVALVLKKENPGYLFNAMFGELAKAAQTLAAGGVASVEDIDRAWMGVMNAPIGPFGIIDSIGLDTVLKVTDYWAEVLQDPTDEKNADFIRKYVEEGKLGTKIGRGFYDYPNPDFVKPGFIDRKEA